MARPKQNPLTVGGLLEELVKLENLGYKNRPVYIIQGSEVSANEVYGNRVVGAKLRVVTPQDGYTSVSAVCIIDGDC